MISKAEQKLTYPLALILSTANKKTCQSLAKVTDKSGDTMLRMLEHHAVTFEELATIAKRFFEGEDVYMLIDDTLYFNASSMKKD